MNKLKFALIACLGVLLITACDPEEPTVTSCDTDNMTYTDDIKSILDESCAYAGCHDDTTVAASIDLSTYDNAVVVVEFGRILGTINHQETFSPMPKGQDKLSDCNIDKITSWINNGTPE